MVFGQPCQETGVVDDITSTPVISCTRRVSMFIWLVVWNMAFIFPFSWECHNLIPTDFHSVIFQSGRYTTNQLFYDIFSVAWLIRMGPFVASSDRPMDDYPLSYPPLGIFGSARDPTTWRQLWVSFVGQCFEMWVLLHCYRLKIVIILYHNLGVPLSTLN